MQVFRSRASASDPASGRAVGWIDLSTLAVPFGLMVLSALFTVSGLYDYCADRIALAADSPRRLLAITMTLACLWLLLIGVLPL